MEGKYVLYTRKFIDNRLLYRKQMVLEIVHPDIPNVPKAELREKLAKQYKSKAECVVVYGLKTKFGGGRSIGFALIYDSMDLRTKYDSKAFLGRDKLLPAKVGTRKQKKEVKGRRKRVRGIAKAKVTIGGKKK